MLHLMIILLVIFNLAEIYVIVRYNHWKGYDWFHLPLQVTNRVSLASAKWSQSAPMSCHSVPMMVLVCDFILTNLQREHVLTLELLSN